MHFMVGHGQETESAAIRAASAHMGGAAVGSVACYDTDVDTNPEQLLRVAGQHAVSEATSTGKSAIAVVCKRSKKRALDSDTHKDAFIAWGLAIPA